MPRHPCRDHTRVGWTVGTGVEWAFWNDWSAKLEYDYMNFGTRTFNEPGATAPGALGGPAAVAAVLHPAGSAMSRSSAFAAVASASRACGPVDKKSAPPLLSGDCEPHVPRN
jgi:hypothetical protein